MSFMLTRSCDRRRVRLALSHTRSEYPCKGAKDSGLAEIGKTLAHFHTEHLVAAPSQFFSRRGCCDEKRNYHDEFESAVA